MSVIKSEVKSEVRAPISSRVRAFREEMTRVGIIYKARKGRDTQAKQANRWTP
jgi:hypothetical protein